MTRPDRSDPIGWLPGKSHPSYVWGHDAVGLGMRCLVQLGDTIATMSEWAEALPGVSRSRGASRLKHGWSALDALAGEPRFEADPEARAFVDEHEGGATLEEIGAVLGVTRERVRQIEEAALRKARAACAREGIDAETFLYGLMQRRSTWSDHVTPDYSAHGSVSDRAREMLADGEWHSVYELMELARCSRSGAASALGRMANRGEAERSQLGRHALYRLAAEEVAA